MNQDEIIARAEATWQARVRNNGYGYTTRKPSKKYLTMQAEFFSGVMCAMNVVYPLWYYSIIRGDDIIVERELLMNAMKEGGKS